MSARGRRGVAAMLWLAGTPVAAADRPVYAVVRVGSEIARDQIVGAKRAGLLCLPAGSIRWSAVSSETSLERRETVQDALEDAGVAVTPLGDTGTSRQQRLRAIVKDAAFSLCAKHWGVGDAASLSGDARLTIQWRLESHPGDGLERTHDATVSRTLDRAHAAPLAGIYRLLLQDAAKEVAGWLAAGQPAAAGQAAPVTK